MQKSFVSPAPVGGRAALRDGWDTRTVDSAGGMAAIGRLEDAVAILNGRGRHDLDTGRRLRRRGGSTPARFRPDGQSFDLNHVFSEPSSESSRDVHPQVKCSLLKVTKRWGPGRTDMVPPLFSRLGETARG